MVAVGALLQFFFAELPEAVIPAPEARELVDVEESLRAPSASVRCTVCSTA